MEDLKKYNEACKAFNVNRQYMRQRTLIFGIRGLRLMLIEEMNELFNKGLVKPSEINQRSKNTSINN